MSISFGTTAELISADFFKGHSKVLLFAEDNSLIEAQFLSSGMNVIKKYDGKGELPEIVIGYGDIGIKEGRIFALKYNVPLYIIPTSFSIDGLNKGGFKSNSLDFNIINCEIVYCKELFLEQSRESITNGMGYALTLIVALLDGFFSDIVFGREGRGEQTLKYISECLKTGGEFTLSENMLSEKLLELIMKLQDRVEALEQENLSLIGARLFALYKRGSDDYSDYLFLMAYTLLLVYASYEAPPPLIFPCDRLYFRDVLNDLGLTERSSVACDVKDIERRGYLLSEWSGEIKALKPLLDDFAKAYKRLSVSSGYHLTELATSDELILIFPILAEYSEGWSILKQLYSDGILEKLG